MGRKSRRRQFEVRFRDDQGEEKTFVITSNCPQNAGKHLKSSGNVVSVTKYNGNKTKAFRFRGRLDGYTPSGKGKNPVY